MLAVRPCPVHLTYGERLRRDRATNDARRHLTAARDIFSQLGAAPWAARAGSELRPTGQPVARDQRPYPVTLTPQQREIAALAAAGLTNKQIGERLYLSHRTVATHRPGDVRHCELVTATTAGARAVR